MSDLKKYVHYVIAVLKPGVIAYVSTVIGLYMALGIVTCINSSVFGDNEFGMVAFLDLFGMNILVGGIIGLVMTLLVFEMGMRIRADRHPLLLAIGIIGVGSIVSIIVFQRIIECVLKFGITYRGITFISMYERLGAIQVMGIYLVAMMTCMFLGAFYKRFGIMKLLFLGGVVIVSVSSLLIYSSEGLEKFLEGFIHIPGILWIIAGALYGITFALLRQLPLGGYQIQKK